MKYFFLAFIVFLISHSIHAQQQNAMSIHLEMGIPLDDNASNDYLIIRPQYALSYNQQLNVANWISWNLHRGWYGSVPRYSGNFIADTSLPAEFYKVKHSDYTNSGYDRGHMVRSEERTATDEDNRSTFLLTNIMPQTPTLNQQTWLSLELECERMCKNDNKELFVIAGGLFGPNPKRLNTVVSVPDSCWKIIVILDSGQRLKDITPSTRVIAVMMKNGTYTSGTTDWKQYTTTVDAIEQSTGYDFLSDVPKQIQSIIEAKNYVSVQETLYPIVLQVFPNPARQLLTLSLEGMNTEGVIVAIVDMMGKVLEKSFTESSIGVDGQLKIHHDITHLPIGAYSIVITSTNNSIAVPFLKND